ncbi:EF-hand calcium-binding domain-containing protein 10 [Protopterus annectens]|uniref:EF-hand calcium-binding domain-containing protein 10 n=1 Tax=Protopterus annectens TaxID=7888 RepID=UPI001CFA3E27|nr:EF-hand calcium-binding domain-containing protein 10 [Protopterus annectens]
MASTQEMSAVEYLQQHKIMELMNNLNSLLFFHRPAKPREFLITQLEKLRMASITGMDYPCLFSESNLDAVFGILDPSKRGFITLVQYVEVMKTLGITSYEELPHGSSINRITLDTFKKEAKNGLMKSCATFKS